MFDLFLSWQFLHFFVPIKIFFFLIISHQNLVQMLLKGTQEYRDIIIFEKSKKLCPKKKLWTTLQSFKHQILAFFNWKFETSITQPLIYLTCHSLKNILISFVWNVNLENFFEILFFDVVLLIFNMCTYLIVTALEKSLESRGATLMEGFYIHN